MTNRRRIVAPVVLVLMQFAISTAIAADPTADPPPVVPTNGTPQLAVIYGRDGKTYVPLTASQRAAVADKKKFAAEFSALQDQNRTIWFLRPFRSTDREGRVGLFESLRNEPTAFTHRFSQSDSARILWLSDLHLSDRRDEHGFPLEPTPAQLPLAQALEKASGVAKKYGGLLISGDLTWRAVGNQFRLARKLIGDVRSWSGMEASQVGVIPGNHDLAFSSRPFANDEPVTETWAEARGEYAAFYEQEFFQLPNQYLSMGRRFLLRNTIAVEVILLNSSLLQQAAGQFQGHGFIGDEQMSAAATQMGWFGPSDESPRAYRVVLHHHLLPITYRQEPVWTLHTAPCLMPRL